MDSEKDGLNHMALFRRKSARCVLLSQDGMTLVELVIVLAMIGILMSTSLVVFNNTRERGMVANLYNEIRLIKIAAGRFQGDCGFFPLDVGRGVDPGLAEKFGWKDGQHSAAWDTAEAEGMLDSWNGPYLAAWTMNPWGGYYDWDNYPPGYNYMGISGGSVFVSLKAGAGGGQGSMPSSYYENVFQNDGFDVAQQPNIISIWIGRYGE